MGGHTWKGHSAKLLCFCYAPDVGSAGQGSFRVLLEDFYSGQYFVQPGSSLEESPSLCSYFIWPKKRPHLQVFGVNNGNLTETLQMSEVVI